MTDTPTYRSTLFWRRSVSESDTDPLNSTVNLRGNPSQYIPPDRAESNPNISVSAFINESPYNEAGEIVASELYQQIRIKSLFTVS